MYITGHTAGKSLVPWVRQVSCSRPTVAGKLEFNVRPFQHKYGYTRDERSGMESYPYPVKEG